jgi:outer membrane protein TolC
MTSAVDRRAGTALLLICWLSVSAGCTADGNRQRPPVSNRPSTQSAHPHTSDAVVRHRPNGHGQASVAIGPKTAKAESDAAVIVVSATNNSALESPPAVEAPLDADAAEHENRGDRSLPAATPPGIPSDARPTILVDFHEVLDLAAGQNPQVAFAHERIREAFAQLQEAELLWLPSLRAGLNYHKHEGVIQTSRGEVIDTSRNSFFTGFGSRVVGGGSPGLPGVWMQFHLADAVFQPQIADRAASARQHAAQATLNDTMLSVALAYLALLQALQEQAVSEETLQNITELSDLVTAFAETGLAPQADVDRVRTELSLRRNQLRRSQETVAVTSSRLVRLLSGDQSVLLLPAEATIVPIELVSPDEPVRSLVQTGLLNRPELHENQFLVSEAVQRLNREKYAPLIPSVLLGLTYGGMGGGLGSEFRNWDDRLDFDVAAWWEIRQLGLGERAIRDGARSRVEQARWRQVQTMDLIAQEVTEAYAQMLARKDQIDIAQTGLEFALQSHRRNIDRIRQGQGLPLEALQSVQALDVTRREYLRSIVDYNESQFRLHRALGWPLQ